MGQNHPLELSEEEKNELLMELFREWWLSATQALVEHVGSSKALGYLAPGFRHHGRAGFQIMAKSMGWKEDDLRTIASFEPFAKTIISGKPVFVELREDGVIWTVQGCSTQGKCKEACLSWCYHAGVGMIGEFGQSMEYYLHESLSQGDKRCLGSIEKNGHGLPFGRVIQSYSLETSHIGKQDWNFWSRAAMGEVWAIVTRAAVECLGEQEALSVLNPQMQQSGITLGNHIMNKIGNVKARDDVDEIVILIQSCFAIKGKETKVPYSGEIFICPFSGGPIEMCHQFEAFLNGLCMAIDPDLEFAYDHMMTKGDKTCHWTIRKKGEIAKETVKEDAALEDPIKRLTNKYIDGEITEEEFRKKLTVLKELRL